MSALLVLSAALLVVGTTFEASTHLGSTTSTHTETPESSSGESTKTHTDEQTGNTAETSPEATVFGVNLENPILIGATIAASLILAFLMWWRPKRLVLAAVISFSVVAGALDVREVIHQISLGSALLVTIAAILIAMRLATIGGSVLTWKTHKQASAGSESSRPSGSHSS